MRIESDKSEINKPAAEIFSFLSDFNNFQKLMPPQVSNWKSTTDECSFTLSGMATIGMKITEKIPNTLVKISSIPALGSTSSKMPLDFTLSVYLTEITPVQCTGQFIFESDLNPMMKIMLEKPLTKFFNFLAGKMKEV